MSAWLDTRTDRIVAGLSGATGFEIASFLDGVECAIRLYEETRGDERGFEVSRGPAMLTVRVDPGTLAEILAVVQEYVGGWNRTIDAARAFGWNRDAERVQARCPCCGFYGDMDRA